MTNNNGKPLALCAANIAVLEATGKQTNKALGALQQEIKETNKNIQLQQIAIGRLADNVDRLTSSQKELSIKIENIEHNTLDRINKSRSQHESNCVFYQAAKKKTEKDITKRFLVSSSPNDPIKEEDVILVKKIRNLPKKVKTAITIGVIIAPIIGIVIGYFQF